MNSDSDELYEECFACWCGSDVQHPEFRCTGCKLINCAIRVCHCWSCGRMFCTDCCPTRVCVTCCTRVSAMDAKITRPFTMLVSTSPLQVLEAEFFLEFRCYPLIQMSPEAWVLIRPPRSPNEYRDHERMLLPDDVPRCAGIMRNLDSPLDMICGLGTLTPLDMSVLRLSSITAGNSGQGWWAIKTTCTTSALLEAVKTRNSHNIQCV